MNALVRNIATLGVLGAALAACTIPGASHHAPRASASPSAFPTTTVPGPPTLAPGPQGLAAVFKRAPTHEKVVALTFDADMTAAEGRRAAAGEHFDNPGLIGALRELRVPATVFLTGRWVDQYPRQARAIGRDPLFEVGSHSYSHYSFAGSCYGLPILPPQRMRSDVERGVTALHRAGVPHPVPYFRFPGGCYDNRALRTISALGMTAVQWDVVSGDAFATDADAVVRQVLRGVRPGSVVIMHCTRGGAPVTEKVVRAVVPELRKRGYRFAKVSELIGASGGRRQDPGSSPAPTLRP
ncbi:polysaccharide deacetylase family protein [Streptomyces sp. NPDC005708]|uniref:polysaccharide deacetylase family protein n=1 Tax=unclassified Streptomyces TaxID=2593676 RepID=UPI00341051D5